MAIKKQIVVTNETHKKIKNLSKASGIEMPKVAEMVVENGIPGTKKKLRGLGLPIDNKLL